MKISLNSALFNPSRWTVLCAFIFGALASTHAFAEERLVCYFKDSKLSKQNLILMNWKAAPLGIKLYHRDAANAGIREKSGTGYMGKILYGFDGLRFDPWNYSSYAQIRQITATSSEDPSLSAELDLDHMTWVVSGRSKTGVFTELENEKLASCKVFNEN